MSAELRRSRLCGLVLALYRVRRLRRLCVRAAEALEGGLWFSATLREILLKYHGVKVGAYSYGECLKPGSFPPGVSIGRYVSIARDVRALVRNHPLDRISTHPFFFNPALGVADHDDRTNTRLVIEHDAWIGERAIITPGCGRIGIGAVVGAGAIVTKDVPNFAIVAGNPARLIRYRFDDELCRLIEQSRWWERSIDDCSQVLSHMVASVKADHPFLAAFASPRMSSAVVYEPAGAAH